MAATKVWPDSFDVVKALEQAREQKSGDILTDCMCLGQYQRYMKWEQLRQSTGQGSTPYFADSDHNANGPAPALGPRMPVQLRHASVVAHHLYRFVTPLESVSEHGHHVHESISQQWGLSPLAPVLAGLKPWQVQSLSGNGMHLPTIEAMILYLMSNIVWLDEQATSVSEVMIGSKSGTAFFESV